MPKRLNQWITPIVLLIVAWAYRQSHQYELLADAVFLILENTYIDDLWGNVTHDYFWSSSQPSGLPYWRPMTRGSWSLEHLFFGNWSGGYHLVQVGWHLVAVGGVIALARAFGATPLWAGFAGLGYGVHPTLVEATCLVMARSDVVCGAGVVWSLFAWYRWSTSKHRGWLALHLLAGLVALGSKEAAVVLAPLLSIWCLLLGWGASGQRHRFKAVAPIWVLTAAYLAARFAVLGHQSSALSIDPLRIFSSIGTYVLGSLPLVVYSGVHNLSLAEASDTMTLLYSASVWLTGLLTLLWALRRGHWQVTVLLLWAGASLAPVVLVAEMNVPGAEGKFPLAARWASQSVCALMILISIGASHIALPRIEALVAGLFAVWLFALVYNAPRDHSYYATGAGLIALEDLEYARLNPQWRTPQDRCRSRDRAMESLLHQSKGPEVLAAARQLNEACPESPFRRFCLFRALVLTEHYAKAVEIGGSLAKFNAGDLRSQPSVHYLYGQSLSRLGKHRQALEQFAHARTKGYKGCNLHIERAGVLESLKQWGQVAAALEEAMACSGKRPPMMRLYAAQMWHKAARPARATALLNTLDKEHLTSQARQQFDVLRRQVSP
ncbi:MAG TPA: hypothetical protein DCQ06_07415 [Myxococcales bacterium]|nr:hypothetical protein [Myxococcales bacterium]HAN31410.1 hypothetical protein [Myxococcales bacterium]